MNPLGTLIIVVAACASTAAEIPAGTHLLLRMEHSISTSSAKAGDGVHLRTVTPISANGTIIIPVGSYAQGVITDVQRSRRNRGQAELGIQLTTLILTNGKVFQISPKTSSIEPDPAAGPAQRSRAARFSPPGTFGIHPGGSLLGVALAGAIAGGQTGARIGLGVGVAAAVISEVIARGKEVELRQGMALDVVFDRPATIE